MAPQAAQVAAFKKHRCPNPWTIMDREALDVENCAVINNRKGLHKLPDLANESLPFSWH